MNRDGEPLWPGPPWGAAGGCRGEAESRTRWRGVGRSRWGAGIWGPLRPRPQDPRGRGAATSQIREGEGTMLNEGGERGRGGTEVERDRNERHGRERVRRGWFLGRPLENVSFGCVIFLLYVIQTLEWVSDLDHVVGVVSCH